MSTADEIGLCEAKRRLESSARSVRERLERARGLYGVAERKRTADNLTATLDRVTAVRRLLGEAKSDLAAVASHRDRIGRHVQSHPQIEGGIYHGTVQTHDGLRRTVTERKRRTEMELAVVRHRSDQATSTRAQGGVWEDAFDTVRDAIHLLTHILGHDLPALVHEIEERDALDGSHHPTAGLTARLSLAREYRERIAALDHEAIAREAARVNSELGAEYRSMVDRFRIRDATLEDDLAVVAAFVAGRGSRDDVLGALGDVEAATRPSDR